MSREVALNPATAIGATVTVPGAGSVFTGGLLSAPINGDTGHTYQNEAFGYQAMSTLTVQNQTAGVGNFTGAYNTAFGYQALKAMQGQTGGPFAAANAAFGQQALMSCTSGIQNTGIGCGALINVTSGINNTGIGFDTLNHITTGSDSTAVGYAAGFWTSSGLRNTYIGDSAGYANTTLSDNTALGYHALVSANTGNSNTAIGSSALQAAFTGGATTAVGANALWTATSGTNNNAIGSQAGYVLTTGSFNVFDGCQAGYAPGGTVANATVAGTGNVFVGYNTGAASADDPSYGVAVGWQAICENYGTALGTNAGAKASGAVAIGCDSGGVGASSATANLIVLGTANHTTQIPGLPAFVAADKYLVVDSTGKIHKSALGPAS